MPRPFFPPPTSIGRDHWWRGQTVRGDVWHANRKSNLPNLTGKQEGSRWEPLLHGDDVTVLSSLLWLRMAQHTLFIKFLAVDDRRVEPLILDQQLQHIFAPDSIQLAGRDIRLGGVSAILISYAWAL